MTLHLSRRQACIAMAAAPTLLHPIAARSVVASQAQTQTQAVWKALRMGGHTILMRHALAPGTFDPPEFKLGDCSTQRNLSDAGRAQATSIGQMFNTLQIPVGQVFSSEWCRCVDTAQLAFGADKVKTYSAINSPTQITPAERQANTNSVRSMIQNFGTQNRAFKPGQRKASQVIPNQVLVTHMFNIQDITGLGAAEGEIVVMREGDQSPRVVGRVATV